jgi:predicted TIM-barrel fold metal-dependent hydrolase
MTQPEGTAAMTTPIIDVDSHWSEPPDLWTSRMPKKWAEQTPYVKYNPALGVDDWMVGDQRLVSPGFLAMAGHSEYSPGFPKSYDDFDPAAWQAKPRLERMNEYGVYAQVMFPNVLAFYSWAFREMQDQEAAFAAHRAYNEGLSEFCSEDPERLLAITCVPFWDLEESVKELHRAKELGHRGLLFGWEFERIGLPPITDKHWEPILKTAEELEMHINLHVAVGTRTEQDTSAINKTNLEWNSAEYAGATALAMMSNTAAIVKLTTSGMMERYPNLKWVSIESGFGYIPFLLESLDWQWHNGGAIKDNPQQLLPSEAFRKHMYGSFWFEANSAPLLPQLADNIMFETDFPHPTSLSPGPASTAQGARDTVKRSLDGVPDDVVRKVLFDTASKLYKVAPPAGYTPLA